MLGVRYQMHTYKLAGYETCGSSGRDTLYTCKETRGTNIPEERELLKVQQGSMKT